MTESLGLPAFSAGALPVLSDNCPLSANAAHRVHDAAPVDPLVAAYCQAARADNTRRAYTADLAHFQKWGGHLPSSAEEVARYLAHHATTLKPVTLRRRLAALATVHKDHGATDPTKHTLVVRVMQGIERKHGCPPKQVAPLLINDLARIVARMGGTRVDLRDKAILLVGFFGALRRSEIIALRLDDIAISEAGLLLTVRKSKTDQMAQGQYIHILQRSDELCPIVALQMWLSFLGTSSGAIFPQGDGGRAISDRTIARIVKRRVTQAEIDATFISAHSLRAGFATSASLAGLDATLIARHTRHRSKQMLAKYVRPTLPPQF